MRSEKLWRNMDTVAGLLVGLLLMANQGLAAGTASVAVVGVRPDKVLYSFGDAATAAVTLSNLTAQVQKGTMTAREEWDVVESRVLQETGIELQPGESRVVTVKWNIGKMPFGRGLRVTLEQGGVVTAQGVEFYQATNPKEWVRSFILFFDEHPYRYGNLSHYFDYAPSSFTDLAPQTNQWNTSCGLHYEKDKMMRDIREGRQKGMFFSAYTICMGTGAPAWEVARQHPEWFLKNAKGAFYDQANWWPLDPMKIAAGASQAGGPVYPDMSNPEVVQFAADQIVQAIRMFELDAIFFDGIYGILNHNFDLGGNSIYTWDQKVYNTPEQVQKGSVDTVRKTREIVRAACPEVLLWYNGSFPAPGNILNDAKRESLRGGNCGVLMEMQGGFINEPNNLMHQWRNLYEGLVNFRDVFVKEWKELDDPVMANGYYYNMNMLDIMTKDEFAATRDNWTPCNHIGAFWLATRMHPCTTGDKGFRPVCQFMTRYSAFLWGRDVKCMPNPGERLSVDSNREVWWEEGVYTRRHAGYEDTLIHIVNSPDLETVDLKASRDPAPAKQIEIEYQALGKAKCVKAWMLQPYGYGSQEKEPVRVALETRVDGNKVYVELPPVTFYALVMFRETAR